MRVFPSRLLFVIVLGCGGRIEACPNSLSLPPLFDELLFVARPPLQRLTTDLLTAVQCLIDFLKGFVVGLVGARLDRAFLHSDPLRM